LLYNIESLLAPYKHIRVINWILYFASSIRLILKKQLSSVMSLTFAIIAHSFGFMCSYVLARSLLIDITPMQIFTLMPPIMLATILPISIGGWGVREASTVGLLAFVGVSQTSALMLSIQSGLMLIFISLPACLLWLMYHRHVPHSLALSDNNITELNS
jgi:hypothetical protein